MTISYYEKIGSEIRCIDDEVPFEIPNTWEWIRLENCCAKEIRRGKSPKYIEQSGILVFAQKCNTKCTGIDIGLSLYLDEGILGKYSDDEYMQDGDIVINSTGTGTLGRVGFYRSADNRANLPMLMETGIKRVELEEPAFTSLRDGSGTEAPQVAALGTVTVKSGGYEDE